MFTILHHFTDSWSTHFTPPSSEPSSRGLFTDNTFEDNWYVYKYSPVYEYNPVKGYNDPRVWPQKLFVGYKRKNSRKLYFDIEKTRFDVSKLKYIDKVELETKGKQYWVGKRYYNMN